MSTILYFCQYGVLRVHWGKKMNLNDFSKWLQYNRVKNLRGSEYFPYPLYLYLYILPVKKIWTVRFYVFLRNSLLLTKPAFIWSKIQQIFCEIFLLLKITAFYLNILKRIITPVFSVTWPFRNHSNILICCSGNIYYYYYQYLIQLSNIFSGSKDQHLSEIKSFFVTLYFKSLESESFRGGGEL